MSAKTRLKNTTPVASKASRNSILSPSNFLTPIRPIGFYSLWLHLFFLSEFPGLALLAKKPRTAARGGQMATESLAPVRHAWIVIVLLQSRSLSAQRMASKNARSPGHQVLCARANGLTAPIHPGPPQTLTAPIALLTLTTSLLPVTLCTSVPAATPANHGSRSLHNAPSTTPTTPLTPEHPSRCAHSRSQACTRTNTYHPHDAQSLAR